MEYCLQMMEGLRDMQSLACTGVALIQSQGEKHVVNGKKSKLGLDRQTDGALLNGSEAPTDKTIADPKSLLGNFAPEHNLKPNGYKLNGALAEPFSIEDLPDEASGAHANEAICIRPYRKSDRETFCRLCCDTGFLGSPMDPLFQDRELFADLFTRPYLAHELERVLVAEVQGQVVGYLLGSVCKHFDVVLLWSGLRTMSKMLLRLATGRYGHHPRSRKFIRWLLTAGFREQPKHPRHAAHLHIQIDKRYRGRGVARQLWEYYERQLRSVGMTQCYGAFFSYPPTLSGGGLRPVRLHRIRAPANDDVPAGNSLTHGGGLYLQKTLSCRSSFSRSPARVPAHCIFEACFKTMPATASAGMNRFFDWGNPTMFGPAIYDAYAGRLDSIRERLSRKRNYICRLGTKFYLESSHAFLKSTYLAAVEFFPDMRLIHLIRDPLMVAKSEAVREWRRQQAHAPFHYYRGDNGQHYFYWSLTTHEEIYRNFDVDRLSLFQKYLIQWIEIENRAMRFLNEHQLHHRCFTLDSPRDLNTASRIHELFDFLGMETVHPRIVLGGRRNESLGHTTVIHNSDKHEVEEVIERLPERYLEIFRHEPYTHFAWSARLRGSGSPSEISLQHAAW